MRAFIIRPFGTKKGIDFDAVEKLLIDPALQILGVAGRTTLDILRQGNIRLDMFQRLLTADLVVADISIANANVFYELGIRHALRDKRTFLIRCESAEVAPDEVPFDLKTDRYLSYPIDRPDARLNDFVKALAILKPVRDHIKARDIVSGDKIAKVSLVGVGMRSHAGIASTAFRALAEEGINIQMISTSEIKVSVVIDEKYTELAVRVLHKVFGLEQAA